MDNTIQEFWNAFQKDYGQSNLTYIEAFAFGSGGFMADRLLALVLQGKKTATCSSKAAWGNSPLPRPGDLSIVLDGRGQARCVIETQSVHLIALNEVKWELAHLEGEDETLDSWRVKHRAYFQEEAAREGRAFQEDMPLVFETFKTIYIKPEDKEFTNYK